MKKVLIVLHGMPPLPGRTVVGAGLRAFANGEGLRTRGHRVFYATRTEDLPGGLRERAEARRAERPAPSGPVSGSVRAPGSAPPRRPPLAVGHSPEAGSTDDPLRSVDWSEELDADEIDDPAVRTDRRAAVPWTPTVGLAPVGGPLGAPGNPFPFTEPDELREVVRKVDPDVVLVEAVEEARHLPEGRFAVVLDLFAPRLIEQQFMEGQEDREAVRLLDALQRADHFLFSNARQKYYHLPLLALAGVDCTRDAGDVVRISCPPDSPPLEEPEEPVFVAGGVFWPWADLSQGLVDLLAVLDRLGRGRVDLYGGRYALRSDTTTYKDPLDRVPKDHPRLRFKGLVPIDTLWDEYRRASVAFDLMAPNPEREINLSFRQVDYLRCGLPIITAPGQVIARELLDGGAGWTVRPGDREALGRLVESLLAEPRTLRRARTAAQRLARERYAWTITTQPLARWIERPTRRASQDTVLARLSRTQADLWDEHRAAGRLRERVLKLQDELDKKNEEIGGLNDRMRALITSVDRLSGSMEEVSKFKSDTLRYLHEEQDEALKDAAELARELERKALDLRKKGRALDKARAEITKLKDSLRELRTDNEQLEARFVARDRDALALTDERRDLARKLGELQREVADERRGALAAAAALQEAQAERQRLDARSVELLEQAEAGARRILLAASGRAAAAESARAALQTRLSDLRDRLGGVEAELTKKQAELEAAREGRESDRAETGEALAEAVGRAERAEAARGRAVAELTEAKARLAGARADLAKKEAEVEALQTRFDDHRVEASAALDRLAARARERLERAQAEAERLLEGALEATARAEGERQRAAQRASEAADRLTVLRGDLAKKEGEIESLHERLREEAEAGSALAAQREAARARVQGLKNELTEARGERDRVREEAEARLEAAREAAAARQAEAEARIRRLDTERGALRERLERAEHESATARAEAESLREHLDALREERADLGRELTDAKTGAEVETNRLRERLARVEGKLAESTVELESERTARREAGAALTDALQRRDSLRDELEAALLQAQESAARALAERNTLESRAKELQFEVGALRTSDAESSRQLAAAQQDRAETQAKLDEALEQGAAAAAEVERLRYELDAAGREAGKKARELTEAQTQRDDAHREKTDALRWAADQEKRALTAEKRAAQIERRAIEAEATVRELRALVDGAGLGAAPRFAQRTDDDDALEVDAPPDPRQS